MDVLSQKGGAGTQNYDPLGERLQRYGFDLNYGTGVFKFSIIRKSFAILFPGGRNRASGRDSSFQALSHQREAGDAPPEAV